MRLSTTPKIGEERIYRDVCGVLYPGEHAEVEVRVDLETGEQTSVWFVGPTPGFRGWWLRTRYRLFGDKGNPDVRFHE